MSLFPETTEMSCFPLPSDTFSYVRPELAQVRTIIHSITLPSISLLLRELNPINTTTTTTNDDTMSSESNLSSSSPSDTVTQPSTTKSKRNQTTPYQLHILRLVFATNRYPNLAVRHQLARQLDLPIRTVQVWFQNRRQTLKAQSISNTSFSPVTPY